MPSAVQDAMWAVACDSRGFSLQPERQAKEATIAIVGLHRTASANILHN